MMRENLRKIIRYRRTAIPLTLQQLATVSGVSVSHLARIESGGRFPSPWILRKIAQPLGFTEQELLVLAGYISPNLHPSRLKEEREEYVVGQLDVRVAKVLAQEPVEVQRAVLKILPALKSIARDIAHSDAAAKQFIPDEPEQFNGKDNAPHDPEVLYRFPVVGELRQNPQTGRYSG